MLQAVLGEHSDEYMKNIVATIQKEQNDIIRDTKHDLLLVQGVAGSGKTSAILQRIAFLLYHSNRKLSADQIVLFSPNLLKSSSTSLIMVANKDKGRFCIMAEIKYEVVQRIAVLSERPRGWERQLNLISWNDGEPKYDIRDWSPDGTRMGKGISLSHDELAILKGILEDMEL